MAKSSLSGEILHFVGIRFRVTGSGDLKVYLRSLNDVRNVQLPSITMSSTTNREPVSLATFREQRAQLEIKTTEINETFTISRIVVFVKPSATGYPQ